MRFSIGTVRLHRRQANRDHAERYALLIKLVFILLLSGRTIVAQSSESPDLSGVSQEDRVSIESACAYQKYSVGPAAYHQCVAKQLATLGDSRTPNLSGVSQEDRVSIESACAYQKYSVGPTAYHQCVEGQLNELTGTNQSFNNSSSRSASYSVQNNGQTRSNPSPELQKLDYFRGGWVLEGEIKTSTFGPTGKFSGTQQNEWASDHLSLISHWSESRPGGNSTGKAAYSYDSNQKVYNYRGTDSEGEAEDLSGTVIANTWTWLNNFTGPSGDSLRGRYTETITSLISYDFKFDTAPQNGEWTIVFEGKAKKSK